MSGGRIARILHFICGWLCLTQNRPVAIGRRKTDVGLLLQNRCKLSGIQSDRYKPACKTALPKQSSPCIEGRAEAYRSNRSSDHRAGKPALRQVTAAP